MGIDSRLNPVDGWLSVWWEDRDSALAPNDVAREFYAFIRKSGYANAVVGSETPTVAEALLKIPGFSTLGEESRYMRPWPSGVKAPNMSGIRAAVEADAAEISRILDESFGEAMGGIFPPDRIAREMFEPDWHNWLLEEQGVFVGFASAIHDEEEGVVNFIGVVPSSQGRGHGQRLMELILSELDRRPHKCIALTVESHRTQALRLYEMYGFSRSGESFVNVKYTRPD